MKNSVKQIIRWVIGCFWFVFKCARKDGWVYKYAAIYYHGIGVLPDERDIFTPKAMYVGYSSENLESRSLPKVERIRKLKGIFYRNLGYYLDIDNPLTFNQKVQWLKMFYHDDLIVRCVDKAEVKNYVSEVLGAEFAVPGYGSYDNERDIDFDALPAQFVLKSNVQSDARHILLIKDKRRLNIDKVRTLLSRWLLRQNNLCSSYCNAYHTVTPKIVVEKFLCPSNGSINDYKFYCYGGKCRHFLICKDRGAHTKYINYDENFNCILPSPKSYYERKFSEDPMRIREMIRLAEILAKPFPFVRVDFYDVDGQLYVGELTFYPGGGYNTYTREWDEKFGSYLTLPNANF